MKPPREAVEPPEAARRRGAPCNRFGTLHYVTSCGRAAGRVPWDRLHASADARDARLAGRRQGRQRKFRGAIRP